MPTNQIEAGIVVVETTEQKNLSVSRVRSERFILFYFRRFSGFLKCF